jgi:hypothetical protein
LWTQQIDKQGRGNYETDATSNDITRRGIQEISQNLSHDDGHRQSLPPTATFEPARTGKQQSSAEQ